MAGLNDMSGVMVSIDSVAKADIAILIVDDHEPYIELLERMLKAGFGYNNITSTTSLQEAYDLIKAEKEPYKLLFIDFWFPDGVSGGSFLKRLKQEGLLDNRAAFIITSEAAPEALRSAKEGGALAVIAKPFDREQLRKQLRKAEMILFSPQDSTFDSAALDRSKLSK